MFLKTLGVQPSTFGNLLFYIKREKKKGREMYQLAYSSHLLSFLVSDCDSHLCHERYLRDCFIYLYLCDVTCPITYLPK